MMSITKQEKTVLMFVAWVILSGSFFSLAFKKYPQLKDIVNLIDSNRLYPKVDINAASEEELMAVPYIGEYTAKNIVAYRRKNGKFSALEEIKKVKGIRQKNYQIFRKYLIIGQHK